MAKIWFSMLMLTLMFSTAWVLVSWENTFRHERVHEINYLYGGCKNVSLKYNPFSGQATCNDIGHQQDDIERMLHTQNEIFGYNMSSVLYSIFLSGYIVCMLLLAFMDKFGGKNEEEEHKDYYHKPKT